MVKTPRMESLSAAHWKIRDMTIIVSMQETVLTDDDYACCKAEHTPVDLLHS